jgi:hypothetical protein
MAVIAASMSGDPVAAALGVDEQVASYTYENGLLSESTFAGDSIAEVGRAYSMYVRTFHEPEYLAVCQPAAYEPGSIVQTELLALTGDCAALLAGLSDEVVAWIGTGRPVP